MGQRKLSGTVTAIILVIVVIIVLWVGYRAVNPPQELGPSARAMDEAFRRANPGQR